MRIKLPSNGMIWYMAMVAVSVTLLPRTVQSKTAFVASPTNSFMCQSDIDCQLNGICNLQTHNCECDPAWIGLNCSLLNILPTPQKVSYHGKVPGSTSWGGSVVYHEGMYYMYVAEMVNKCPLSTWTTNSVVSVAVSSEQTGPYKFLKQITEPWAHNPQAMYIPANSSAGASESVWLVYALGDGDGKPIHGNPKDCTKEIRHGSSVNASFAKDKPVILLDGFPQMRPRRNLQDSPSLTSSSNSTYQFAIHYSTESPSGPFQTHRATMTDMPSQYLFPGNWNPAPILLPDGRVRIMVHTNYPETWTGSILVEAPTWRGPYRPITKDITRCVKCQEDPFVWIDHRGNWHALYHRMFDPADEFEDISSKLYNQETTVRAIKSNTRHQKHRDSPIPSPGWSGGHSYSLDGLVWSDIVRCYNTTVHYVDGTQRELLRRERPKLIFASDGVTPTHLSNGAQDKVDGTYTVVVPLQTAKNITVET